MHFFFVTLSILEKDQKWTQGENAWLFSNNQWIILPFIYCLIYLNSFIIFNCNDQT